MPKKERITKPEALNFLLTYIVIEQGKTVDLNQLELFTLSNLAQQAVDQIEGQEGIIPHEIIESLAQGYLESK